MRVGGATSQLDDKICNDKLCEIAPCYDKPCKIAPCDDKPCEIDSCGCSTVKLKTPP